MAQQDLRVNIKGNASGLTNALGKAEGKMKAFGSKMQSVGSSLQTRLALPLLAIGGAAIKMAFDFDKSLAQIKSLVGIAADEVDEMGRRARQMAVATGKSGAEAADALFFITSAGLRGEEAMQTLEASLKAAAIGLGETKTIADLATSAMNAYGTDTLSASDATDILVSAVREGKLEASELAGAMGGVIPVASNMGVGFEEIGAAMAAMSRTGTNASEAATQLNAILASIAKPTSQSTEAFAKMGYSVDDLKKMLDQQGLLQTLINLKSGLDVTGQSFTDIVPNIRAWKGVLDLTGAGLESNKEIFDALTKSMGATNTAFKENSKTASFQFTKSVNKAKESLASLGQQLLVAVVPVLEKAANFVSNLYQAFTNLEPSTQKLIIGLSGFAIVLPTLITLGGTLVSLMGALLSPVGLVAAALAAVAYVVYKNWGEILPVVTGLYNQFVDLYNSSEVLRVGIALMGAAFSAVFIGIKTQVDQVVNVFKTMWNVIKAFSEDGFDAAFGDILDQGFENGKQIASDGADAIAKEFTDAYAEALGRRLEHKTAEEIQGGLDNAVNGVKDYVKGIFGDLMGSSMFAGGGGATLSETIAEDTPKVKEAVEEQAAVLTEAQKKMIANAQMFNESVGEIITGGLNDLAVGIGEALGNALANGGNLAGALAQTLLSTIGNMAVELGKLAIGIGIGLESIQAALKTLNPAVAIAAGVALVALGSFLKSRAAGIAEGGSAGGSMPGGVPTIGGVPAFANGGIVSGPTLGLMGEYPGARSNPEVIAPLSKLQSMIGGRTSDVNVGGEFVVRGTDLVVVLDRASKSRNRLI